MKHIRNITRKDREVYISLAEQFYATDAVMAPIPRAHFERAFEEMLSSDTYASAWLFEEDATVCGYAQIAKTYSQEAGGRVIWIEELYLLPEHRGKGFGSMFFDFLEKEFPDTARFRLEVEDENEGAVRLYERIGYERIPYQNMMKQK